MSKYEEDRPCIETEAELAQNMLQMCEALSSPNKAEQEEAKSLLKRGSNFVVCLCNSGCIFAPSRFVGYKANKILEHAKYLYNDGKETNPAVSKILGPMLNREDGSHVWEKLENAYLDFCQQLDIEPKNLRGGRKYWLFDEDIERDPRRVNKLDSSAESAREGQKEFRAYNTIGRDSSLRKNKLEQCREEHDGHLVCEVCQNFVIDEDIALELEEALFEVHHKTPLNGGERETRSEDLAVLCACCHRLVHYRGYRPKDTLSIEEGQELIPNWGFYE